MIDSLEQRRFVPTWFEPTQNSLFFISVAIFVVLFFTPVVLRSIFQAHQYLQV